MLSTTPHKSYVSRVTLVHTVESQQVQVRMIMFMTAEVNCPYFEPGVMPYLRTLRQAGPEGKALAALVCGYETGPKPCRRKPEDKAPNAASSEQARILLAQKWNWECLAEVCFVDAR